VEPLTSATAFATIISLIGQFRTEHSSQETVNEQQFLEWLENSHHNDLKKLLELNTTATIGIKALLNEDREIVLEKLENIDNILASFASGVTGLSNIAEAINPEAIISNQALSILSQVEASNGSKFLELHSFGGMKLLILDGNGGNIDIIDPRFLSDDLFRLVELKLLRQELNSKGDNLYIFTRAASMFVNSR